VRKLHCCMTGRARRTVGLQPTIAHLDRLVQQRHIQVVGDKTSSDALDLVGACRGKVPKPGAYEVVHMEVAVGTLPPLDMSCTPRWACSIVLITVNCLINKQVLS